MSQGFERPPVCKEYYKEEKGMKRPDFNLHRSTQYAPPGSRTG